MKTKPETLELLVNELTEEQVKLVTELGNQILHHFDSFQLEDLIKHGERKSLSLNRDLMTRWAKAWIAEKIEAGKIEEIIPQIYDSPTYHIKVI